MTWTHGSFLRRVIAAKPTKDGSAALIVQSKSYSRPADFIFPNGRGGIRTHGTLSRTHTFQACALNHSATRPNDWAATTYDLAVAAFFYVTTRCYYPLLAATSLPSAIRCACSSG